MVDDCLIAMMRMIAASPHGSEILDMKGSLAGDLAADWRSRLAERLTRAIEEEAARRGVGLASRGFSAGALADMLLDGLQGMRARTPDPDGQRRGARRWLRSSKPCSASPAPLADQADPRSVSASRAAAAGGQACWARRGSRH